MLDLDKEIFNQFFLDYLEKEILTPKLDTKETLDIAPSRLGIPGTLGIIKTVNSNLIADNLNEKEEDTNLKAHTFFQLNFKIKKPEIIKIKFDLSFVLYIKNFPNFEHLSLINNKKYLNKKLREKKREFAKETSNKYTEATYEQKETIIIDCLKNYMNKLYNPKNHTGLTLVIDKTITLLKSNTYANITQSEILEETSDIEDINSDDEIEENQFLINKSLFLDNGLSESVYNETIDILSSNDGQLYKEFFNEITPNYTYSPLKINLQDIEFNVENHIGENSEINKNLNSKIIKLIEEEVYYQIEQKNINININKKLSLINFINKEQYVDFTNDRNVKKSNNILIYYPKIKLLRNNEHFRITVMGCDYISNENTKSIALFDDRLFNTELKIFLIRKN